MTNPVSNRELTVGSRGQALWNEPDYRRWGFYNLHKVCRYAMSIRSPRVVPLRKRIDWKIGDQPDVARFLAMPHFSAFVILSGQDIVFESYARDCGPQQSHALMSVTKTFLNLMLGMCVARGWVDLDRKVSDYIPQIGSGYAVATVRAVANMDVSNSFSEEYGDPASNINAMRTAFGWQLPHGSATEASIRSLLCSITSDDVVNRTGHALYKSANSDLIGWIIEVASGRTLREWLIEIIEAVGIEGVFQISCDRDGVPQLSGGAAMSARDLARYGLLFSRMGVSVDGQRIGDANFLEQTRSQPGPPMPKPRDWTYYSGQVCTNGVWFGHGGIGGQYLIANPDTGVVVAYLGVLENESSDDSQFFGDLVDMMSKVSSQCY